MFHMGWFLGMGFGSYGWNKQWSGNAAKDIANPQLFIDMATSLERAGFDYMMMEDSSVIPDTYRGTLDESLRAGIVRMDPMPLIPLLAERTSKLGIIATAATTFYPPFLAARLFNTLDHLTNGRVGINLVTASPDAAAQNYGYEKHFEHDQRYVMADEWVRAVKSLWDTWEPGSLLLDEATNTFADPTKVHHANFVGEYYKTRGPLNTVPSPQGHPILCQAGGSPAGMAFGAKHADTILASVDGPEAMRKYREDVHARMVSEGRDPSSVKIMFLVDPILADTDDDANERRLRRDAAAVENVGAALMRMSYISGLDWSKYDLDDAIPDITGQHNGHQSVVDDFIRASKGKTLREALSGQRRGTESVDIWGSPATVAAKMDEVMQEAGGDGFLIALPVTRKNITEVCDGLAPELRRRGLIRENYEFDTFRENLFAF